MVLGEKNHAGYFERIPLPNRTWEKRRCHAVRIGKGRGKGRSAVCFIGGVHGREWGSPDILVYFAMRLLRAYRDRKGIRLGAEGVHRRRRSAGSSRRWTSSCSPRSTPTAAASAWIAIRCGGRTGGRRRAAAAPSASAWTSTGTFRSCGASIATSRPAPCRARFNPGDYETYVGTRAASEPETRNVIWLLDRFPNIRYFVDLHSYGETILHSWGTDENQSRDPRMSFRNRAYDGKRGLIHDDVYREYMPAADEKAAVRMGRHMAGAIRLVRGRKYRVQQSVGLYPTAGLVGRLRVQPPLRRPEEGQDHRLHDGVGPQPRVDAVPPAVPRDAQGHAGGHGGPAGVLPEGEETFAGAGRRERDQERRLGWISTSDSQERKPAPALSAERSLSPFF